MELDAAGFHFIGTVRSQFKLPIFLDDLADRHADFNFQVLFVLEFFGDAHGTR